MYCYLKARADLPPVFKHAFETGFKGTIDLNGLKFGYDGRNELYPKFECKHKGLLLRATLYGITLTNSIHKYCHGHNHTDFTLSDFKESILRLSDETSIDWNKAKILQLEVGCNLVVPNMEEILSSLLRSTSKYFYRMNDNLGVKVVLTNYDQKGYNKTKETPKKYSPRNDLLRWELVIKRFNKEHPDIKLVEQLYDFSCANRIIENMLSKFAKITKVPSMEFSLLTPNEIKIFSVYSNEFVAKQMKKYHPDTYKKELMIFNKLCKNVNYVKMNNFEKRLREKSYELLNG